MDHSPPSFYVDVFSNSNVMEFPGNTLSGFNVVLGKPLHFSTEYELGLCDYIFPNRFNAVQDHGAIIIGASSDRVNQKQKLNSESIWYSNKIFLNKTAADDAILFPKPSETISSVADAAAANSTSIANTDDDGEENNILSWRYNLPGKEIFITENELLDYLNGILTERDNDYFGGVLKNRITPTGGGGTNQDDDGEGMLIKNPIQISSVGNGGGLKIIIRDNDLKLAFQGNIARLLGFPLIRNDMWVCLERAGVYKFPQSVPNINACRPNMLNIYCSCIEPIMTGNTFSPLLKCVVVPPINTEQDRGMVVSREIVSRNYHLININPLHTIRFEIRDTTGEFANFASGIIYFRLHLRPRRQKLRR